MRGVGLLLGVLLWQVSLAIPTGFKWERQPIVPLANADVFYRQGLEYLTQGKLDAAEKAFRESLKVHPEATYARLGIAEVMFQRHKIDEAGKWIEEAVKLSPGDFYAQLSLGRYLKLQGKSAEAKEAFARAASLDSKAVEPRLALGDLYLQAFGQPQQAVEAYQEALSLDPKRAESHYALGVALFHAGQPEKALAELQEAAKLAPDNPLPNLEQARIYLRTGKLAEAERAAIEVLQRQPGLIEGRVLQAEVFLAQRDYDRAEKAYRALLRDHPKLALAYNNLAWILSKQNKNLSEAERLAQKAVALAPKVAEFHETLSQIYFAQGEMQRGCQALAQAVKSAPQDKVIFTRWQEKACEKWVSLR